MKQSKLDFIRQNAPCYLYDKEQIMHRCQALRNAMPEVQFLYSVKANPFTQVVQAVAAQGFGADAASPSEVLLAERSCVPHSRIFYSAPGKTRNDIEKAWSKCTIIADSLSELALLEEHAAAEGTECCVGIRVNPNFTMSGAVSMPSKFGIDEDQLFCADLCFPHLKITGIHVHLQSQVLDTDLLCAYYRNCYKHAERMNALDNVNVQFINFGSGIGTVYDTEMEHPLMLDKISSTVTELYEQNRCGLHAQFLFETGRFIVCNAGTYYTRIVDRKISHGKTYLIVQNAMNGFLRPAIAELLRQNLNGFPAHGQEPLFTSGKQCNFSILGRSGELETVDLVGNLCTALDVLAKDIVLPRADIGDIIAISNAGSYGYTLSPQGFSSHETPKQFLWTESINEQHI